MSDSVETRVVPFVGTPPFRLYQMIRIQPPTIHSLREAVAVAWGTDVFFGPVPVLKVFAAVDVLLHVVLS